METRLNVMENPIYKLGSVLEKHLVENFVGSSRDSDKGYQIDILVNALESKTD